MHAPWTRAALALTLAAMLGALARCSFDFECDRTAAALVLPPGGAVTLRGRACVTAEDGFVPLAGVVVEGEDDESTQVRLSLADPVHGPSSDISVSPAISLEVMPTHCDEGFVFTVENVAPTGSDPLTAWVWISAAVEEFGRCDVSLEAP